MNIRTATLADQSAIYDLYKAVAVNERGIARSAEEITPEYIGQILQTTAARGLILLGIDENSGKVLAAIHAGTYNIRIFDHILTGLTIAVHPGYQGKGLGRQLFTAFLEEVTYNRPDIKRIELESRVSNQASLRLYASLGFVQEGVMKNKTRNRDGSFEDSILMAWTNPDFRP